MNKFDEGMRLIGNHPDPLREIVETLCKMHPDSNGWHTATIIYHTTNSAADKIDSLLIKKTDDPAK
jgi:hypothetical protein